ncbi:hypothetical protein EO087_02990 [Dyella sp. M7H15-1]|uniref:hypothetical protein n=1 Tax=Dyella sp. M7H15-1 TaxID=2501295 RepID=UPI00100509FD|nr:hypothetical protein [Dyella sp. M7H15-1]QAU23080.1 hypothetical protein EO087_02990 [Dyella sp. M7H15-1]
MIDSKRLIFLRVVCGLLIAVGACFNLVFGYAFLMGLDFGNALDFSKAVFEVILSSGIIMLVSCIVVLVRAKNGGQLYALLLLMPVVFAIHYVSVVLIAHTSYLFFIGCLYVAIAFAIPKFVLKLGKGRSFL